MDYITSLTKLGLSEKEARVYVALLDLGTTTAQAVANKAKVKKPTTYLMLEELRVKGLLTKIPRAKKVFYRPKSPYELSKIVDDQVNVARKIIPELAAQLKEDKKVRMTFYEGVEGIKSAYAYKQTEYKNITLYGFYGKANDVSQDVIAITKQWNEMNVKLGVKTEAIVQDNRSLEPFRKEDDTYNRKVTKVSETKYSSNLSLEILPDMIRIILLQHTQAIIIEDKNITKTFKQIFELAKKGALSN